jgi:hypothetical protein
LQLPRWRVGSKRGFELCALSLSHNLLSFSDLGFLVEDIDDTEEDQDDGIFLGLFTHF